MPPRRPRPAAAALRAARSLLAAVVVAALVIGLPAIGDAAPQGREDGAAQGVGEGTPAGPDPTPFEPVEPESDASRVPAAPASAPSDPSPAAQPPEVVTQDPSPDPSAHYVPTHYAPSRVAVQVVDGTTLVGVVIEDAVGEYLTLEQADGSVVSVGYEDIVQIVPVTGWREPTPQAVLTDSERAQRIDALTSERARLVEERPSLGLPIGLMAGGVAFMVTGAAAYIYAEHEACGYYDDGAYYDEEGYYVSDYDDCYASDGMVAAGMVIISGVVAEIVGTALLPGRIARRVRTGRLIDGIDAELQSLGADGVSVRIVPLSLGAQVAGVPNGAGLRVRF